MSSTRWQKLLNRRVVKKHAGVAQSLMLTITHLDQVALGRGERVLENAHQDIGTGPVCPRGGRAAPELLLVELHHRVEDLHQRARAVLIGGWLLLFHRHRNSRWSLAAQQ